VIKRLSLALLVFIGSFSADALDTLTVDDSKVEFVLQGKYFEILEDPSKSLSINDVLSPNYVNKFKLNTENYTFNKNHNSAYWIRFSVRLNSKKDYNYIFESYAPHTDEYDLYYKDDQGNYRVRRSGLRLDFYNREYINKNLVMDFPIKNGEVQTYYIRIFSKSHSGFDYRIKTNNYFSFYSTNEYFFLGIYYGILIIMAVYNFLMYFSIKEKVYLYYVLYVLSGILSTLTDDGLGYQFLWFSFPSLNPLIGYHLAPSLLLISFVLYSREFLGLGENYQEKDKLIKWFVIGYFIYYVLELTILPKFLQFRGAYLVPFIAVYVIAIQCFFQGFKPARFFILGYTFIFFSIFIIQLRATGTVKGNLFTVYSLNYGLVIEVVVLSFGLADRIKIFKKEREEAQVEIIEQLEENNKLNERVNKQLEENNLLQGKVNRELEAKVAERTKELNSKNLELEEANVKLKIMTDKAYEMASKLDIDNWNLKKYVKEEIKARISDQEVPFEEFCKIFPNEHTCFKYLDELKWGNNQYHCRKCSNTKYIKGVKAFSRKCTRCGYVESVTAYTLYHGVRFPIDKAFYLTYFIHRRGNKVTLDELSELLQLRRNTCWNFKKKIMATITDFKKKTKDGKLEHWEEIILN
jgi:hypothetical protein